MRGPQWMWFLATLVVVVGLSGCGIGGSTKTVTVTTPSTPLTGKTGTIAPTKTSPPATSSTNPTAALAADNAAEEISRRTDAAALTYATDNNGSYAGLTPTELSSTDPAIQVGPGGGKPYVAASGAVTVLAGGAGYSVTVTSTTGDTFSSGESATGTPTQTCTGSASSACKSGSW